MSGFRAISVTGYTYYQADEVDAELARLKAAIAELIVRRQRDAMRLDNMCGLTSENGQLRDKIRRLKAENERKDAKMKEVVEDVDSGGTQNEGDDYIVSKFPIDALRSEVEA